MSNLSGGGEISKEAREAAKAAWNVYAPNRWPAWGRTIGEDVAFDIAEQAAQSAIDRALSSVKEPEAKIKPEDWSVLDHFVPKETPPTQDQSHAETGNALGPFMSPEQAWAVDDVLRERKNQHDKWGEQNHDMPTWMLILHEETGELSEAILHTAFGGPNRGNLLQEAVQVAAVAVQIIERLRVKTIEAQRRLNLPIMPKTFRVPLIPNANHNAVGSSVAEPEAQVSAPHEDSGSSVLGEAERIAPLAYKAAMVTLCFDGEKWEQLMPARQEIYVTFTKQVLLRLSSASAETPIR